MSSTSQSSTSWSAGTSSVLEDSPHTFILHHIVHDPAMKQLHWRWLIVMGAVPSVVLGLWSWKTLPESPMFLQTNGKSEEALAVIKHLRSSNAQSKGGFWHLEPEPDAILAIADREERRG